MTQQRKIFFSIFLFFVLIVSLIFWQSQNIMDWAKLVNYVPPAKIKTLADQDTMNSYTRKLFYLNKPILISGPQFRAQCPNSASSISTILGCYHPDQKGIFLFTVDNPELNGVEQVTAAHEVLHCIWARLSVSDKKRVGDMLTSFYENELKDPAVKSEISIYQQTEPGSVLDEMSSTFGTEIADLPPGLNAYYSKYFTNRMAIVNYSAGYKSVFLKYQNKVKEVDQKLSSLKDQIDANQKTLNSSQTLINIQRATMQNLVANNSIDQYNADVPGFNRLVNDYNSLISKTQSLIDQYNQLVVSRNQDALVFDDLSNQLNSNLSTIKAN